MIKRRIVRAFVVAVRFKRLVRQTHGVWYRVHFYRHHVPNGTKRFPKKSNDSTTNRKPFNKTSTSRRSAVSRGVWLPVLGTSNGATTPGKPAKGNALASVPEKLYTSDLGDGFCRISGTAFDMSDLGDGF